MNKRNIVIALVAIVGGVLVWRWATARPEGPAQVTTEPIDSVYPDAYRAIVQRLKLEARG